MEEGDRGRQAEGVWSLYFDLSDLQSDLFYKTINYKLMMQKKEPDTVSVSSMFVDNSLLLYSE